MNLHKIGEFGIIKRISKGIRADKSVVVGIGDDAAALEYSKKEYLLLTCDMLVEGVHFLRNARPYEIGWKAASCSVSDIAAMGGSPKWMVVSVGLPKDLSLGAIDGIYSGIKKAARKFNVNIVGGDTSHSEKLIIDVAMIGVVKKEFLKTRSGARQGDIIFVTGRLGGAVKSGRHLRFIPRLKESQFLVRNFKINAMIDISDGLSSDLWHILKASRAGAVIYEDLLPVAKAATLKSALCEGEDFELLFTLPRKEAIRLHKGFSSIHKTPITPIGEISKTGFGFTLIDKKGSAAQIKPEGYDHFAKKISVKKRPRYN